ncbi:unnamed protein product [Callosobruchus maculatus]|uniref:Uncharacterized protein n=1 Tax=Callosobruchus maculatus TaxID=64391 RepID=A0A653BQA3_CALMS|nr:unnamed protein product [Callosobruchus maculatus]
MIVKKNPPCPTKTARTAENVERMRQALTRSPQRSARRHARELNLSRESVCIKMCIVEQLKPTDYEQREDFAIRIQMLLGDYGVQ